MAVQLPETNNKLKKAGVPMLSSTPRSRVQSTRKPLSDNAHSSNIKRSQDLSARDGSIPTIKTQVVKKTSTWVPRVALLGTKRTSKTEGASAEAAPEKPNARPTTNLIGRKPTSRPLSTFGSTSR